jgi:hypothetical protein
MEPHESKRLDLSKAVSAHEQAEATLVDLMQAAPDPRYERMLERVRQNLSDLRVDTATARP